MKGTFKPLFKACVLMALCFSFSYADAQSMRTYDVSSGLSANSIKDILQDRHGYIWCATSDGLNVFNGVTFKSYGCSYHPTSEDGISALNILSILQHKDLGRDPKLGGPAFQSGNRKFQKSGSF